MPKGHYNRKPAIKRLLDNIEKKRGCWLYTGLLEQNGYVRIRDNYIRKLGHRLTYEYFIGEIPKGLHIDHLCRKRHCLNPKHMEAVTPKENILRGKGLTAVNARKKVCKRGHKLEKDNIAITTKGGRQCIKCRRILDKKYYYQKKRYGWKD